MSNCDLCSTKVDERQLVLKDFDCFITGGESEHAFVCHSCDSNYVDEEEMYLELTNV